MAKQGFTSATVGPILENAASSQGWVLCVGAGTSMPAFPDWTTLVERLVVQASGETGLKALKETVLTRYSADAMIEAAKHVLGLGDRGFTTTITRQLYLSLQQRLSAREWKTVTSALSAAHPNDMSLDGWNSFWTIIAGKCAGISAPGIASAVADTIHTPKAPAGIVSFNAEPLLYAMLNAVWARRYRSTTGRAPTAVLDLVTRSISWRRPNRIPYYFCHGLLPVPVVRRKARASTDKLVFSEASYLSLANNAFAWQSNAFLDLCMARTMVFIGVSLSDPNMRRWMSWVHANRTQELRSAFGARKDSTRHYWLCREPATTIEKRWMEATVAHLGVRVVWLPDWASIEPTLRRMLHIPDNSVAAA